MQVGYQHYTTGTALYDAEEVECGGDEEGRENQRKRFVGSGSCGSLLMLC